MRVNYSLSGHTATRLGNGTWIAWLEFEPSDGRGVTLRTERETTQASWEALAGWASALEAAYFEGAFTRVKIVSTSSARYRVTTSLGVPFWTRTRARRGKGPAAMPSDGL